ncbi:MAG: fucose isomerase, partial [Anaerolineae bacterium]|nr:fucose isomerase [Anaerolineae bacterium]
MIDEPSPIVAFLPIARTTFDIPLAESLAVRLWDRLSSTDLKVVGQPALITDMAATKEAVTSLAEQAPDLLLVLQATFADSTMVLEIAQTIDAPLLLWALPEAHTGGRLRLNSLCGINLAGHGLTRAGLGFDYIYAKPDDPAALAKVKAVAQAGKVRRLLRQTRLGRVGEHPAGFDTCRYDAARLKERFGVEVVQIELAEVFEQAKTAEPEQVALAAQGVGRSLGNLATFDP